MANEKKPSIYYDRGTIGSSDELDEYGVWVKGEPQDLSSVGAESQESADLPEPDLPDMNDLPDFSASGDDSFEESPADNVSLDEDLELPDIDFDDGSEGDGVSGGDDEISDFEESPLEFDFDSDYSEDPDESGESGGDNEGSFGLNEFPEPDFSDFTGPEAEGVETLSGDEAEDLGFVEVSIDAGEDAVVVAEPVQALGSTGGEKPGASKETKPSSLDLSTQLLMRIADELASIRTELSTLKSELAGMKTESVPAETDDAQGRGFFDEEDDEKIALTGDELNNILNTADFTEEAGADATEEAGAAEDFGTPEAEDDSSVPFQEITEAPQEEEEEEEEAGDISLDDITKDLDMGLDLGEKDLDELEGEISFDKADQDKTDEFDKTDKTDKTDTIDQAADEVPVDLDALLEEPVEFDITMNDGGEEAENPFDEILPEDAGRGQEAPESLPGLEDKESGDLRQLREEGAQPMTPAPAPEDAGFLEDDPLAFSEFSDLSEEESLDLSNAVIDEPDLSSEIQENPLEEPSLDDISIDLDLDEEISLDEDMEDGFDGTGGIESPEEEEEEIEVPLSDETAEIETEIGEDDFEDSSADLAVIPEGFVVEAEDFGTPVIDEGEEAFSEITDDTDDIDVEEIREEAVSPIRNQEIQETGEIQEDEGGIPSHLKQELKTVLSYMDQLLESLPDEKIEEFAKSEYFDTYKKLFKELGLV
jgi:hypothetical protein